MTLPLILIAAGGLAREVLAVLENQTAYEVLGVVDDDPALHGRSVGGVPVLGPLEVISEHPDARLAICAGRGKARELIRSRLASLGLDDDRFATLIDPSVRVPSSARIGVGAILLGGTVLTADVEIGRHVVIMPNATLTHDDQIADFVTICAGVALGGSVQVGRGAYVGMNASVRENLAVGPYSVVGMGSVVIRPVEGDTVVGGNPARYIDRSSESPEVEAADLWVVS
jgi:sugar O-acyltransferase (sialic acid O-acetyltransferase NeuD family)